MATSIPVIDLTNRNEIVSQWNGIVDASQLRYGIYEMCRQAVNGDSSVDLIQSVLHDMTKNNPKLANIITDVLNVWDIESGMVQKRPNYVRLLASLSNQTIATWMLKERLEYSTLAEVGIITNERQANTRLIKLKTKLFYKQQKFNLIREESEGYSKLITELCRADLPANDHRYLLTSIKSLIGCFNLDPNRVLDIILECFECLLHQRSLFIGLIRDFLNNAETLNQIIAFKFNNLIKEEDRENKSSDNNGDLFLLTAYLLHDGLISVDMLYPYLAPLDSALLAAYNADLDEAKNYNKKIGEFLLPENARLEDLDVYAEERVRVINADNQKLRLILALVRIGDWSNASRMMTRLPEHYPSSFPEISDALCVLLNQMIDPLYRNHSGLSPVLAKRLKVFESSMTLSSSVSSVDTVERFKSEIVEMLNVLGPYLYRDALLMTKIIRICHNLIDDLRYDILTLLSTTLLPAFSLLGTNAALSEELWSLLALYPYNERYLVYNSWRTWCMNGNNRMMMIIRSYLMRRIKYTMKRLSKSKEIIKQSGRVIGKISHTNPILIFEYVLTQVETYDNLIVPVVESLKYLSSISYDVIIFSIITELSSMQKEYTKNESNSISSWFLSIANFTGSIVKKYPIELPGLLQFIANQLKVGKSLYLLVLKEVVQKMTGIEMCEEVTDEQLEALSGGELLRSEGGSYNAVRNIRKSTQRLKEALMDNNLAMPLCILMAQQRHCIIFEDGDTHLKLVGKLYDQTQETLIQYGNFLANSLTIDDYKRRLPSLYELLIEYNLEPDAAFYLYRPKILHDIKSVFDDFKVNDMNQAKAAAAAAGGGTVVADTLKSSLQHSYNRAVDLVTKSLIPSVKCLINESEISPRLFLIFWMLNPCDIQVPEESYQREILKQTKQKQMIEESVVNDATARRRKERELQTIQQTIERLKVEKDTQKEHVERVRAQLETECNTWFVVGSHSTGIKMDLLTKFLQYCLFPRCKFTAADALFCARFVKMLHFIRTAHFSTLFCFDRLFADITYALCSCTENEAGHYGRFLSEILALKTRWHNNVNMFVSECASYPGFMTKYIDSEEEVAHIDYENFRHLCHKWHYRLIKSFIVCLDSGDYIQIRNSLIVLTKLLPHFPAMTSFANAIERRLEKIREEEKEKRPDLFVLATGYCGQLKLRKASCVPENMFHLKKPAALTVVAKKKTEGETVKATPDSSALSKPTTEPASSKSDQADDGMEPGEVRKTESNEVTASSRRTKTTNATAAPATTNSTTSSSASSLGDRRSRSRKDDEVQPAASSPVVSSRVESPVQRQSESRNHNLPPPSSSSSSSHHQPPLPQSSSSSSSRGNSEHREHRSRDDPNESSSSTRRHKRDDTTANSTSRHDHPDASPVERPRRSRIEHDNGGGNGGSELKSSISSTSRKRQSQTKSIINESPPGKKRKDDEQLTSSGSIPITTSSRQVKRDQQSSSSSSSRRTGGGGGTSTVAESSSSKRSTSRRYKDDA